MLHLSQYVPQCSVWSLLHTAVHTVAPAKSPTSELPMTSNYRRSLQQMLSPSRNLPEPSDWYTLFQVVPSLTTHLSQLLSPLST